MYPDIWHQPCICTIIALPTMENRCQRLDIPILHLERTVILVRAISLQDGILRLMAVDVLLQMGRRS